MRFILVIVGNCTKLRRRGAVRCALRGIVRVRVYVAIATHGNQFNQQ